MSTAKRRKRGLRILTELLLTGSVLLVATSACWASAGNVYIAQSATGAANGADCADAYPYTFFNASANWGAGATQIGPGTIVQVCGTITGTAGASGLLTFQAGGSSGSPITLLFEPGAVLTAPYWGPNGAIYSASSYVIIDGGSNGIIEATANGTALANQVSGTGTVGVFISGGSNDIIRNLTVENIYVHTSDLSDTADGTGAWCIYDLGGSNNSIYDNTLHDCGTGIRYAYQTNTGFSAYGNTIYNINWGIIVGDSDPSSSMSGTVIVHDNDIHDFALWDQTDNFNHHDGIYYFATNSGSSFMGGQIYNNYIHGDPGEYMNTMIFMSDLPHSCGAHYVFNNLLVNESSTTNDTPANGLIQDWCNGDFIYNNTLVGITQSSTNPVNNANIGINVNPGTNSTIENNIIQLFRNGVGIGGAGSISAIDYNDYYDNSAVAWDSANNIYSTLSAWQACHSNGCPSGTHDTNSSVGNPNLSVTYTLQSGSAAIGLAANLTGVGIAALDSDKAGTARPPAGSTSLWSAGAYQFASSTAPQPATGLAAVAH